MSTPIEIVAVVRCGTDACTHAINVPVGERRRPERRPFVEGYTEARGWRDASSPFDIYFPSSFGGARNDWRCPEHSKATA